MRQVRVHLKNKSYRIWIGSGLLKDLGKFLKDLGMAERHWIVVTQKPIWVYHGRTLVAALQKEGIAHSLFECPAAKSSESSKTQAVWAKLIKRLAFQDGQNRSLAILALGGGVIGDLTGFAAAVYRRGIPYVQIPTTLTAQVDSSIGGKNGIDLPEGKNLLGTIYQPAGVVCDVSLLSSMPERHWSDGFAEVIKYGVIKDPTLFEELERLGLEGLRNHVSSLERLIARCARIKAAVVAADEFDKTGVRIMLNFGHTTGHAIETVSRYSRAYTHGEAVGIGMLVACDIAKSMGVLRDEKLINRLEKVLVRFGLPVYHRSLPLDELLKTMGYDKKSIHRKNRFVLPVRLGRVDIVSDVPQTVIVQALEKRKG